MSATLSELETVPLSPVNRMGCNGRFSFSSEHSGQCNCVDAVMHPLQANVSLLPGSTIFIIVAYLQKYL